MELNKTGPTYYLLILFSVLMLFLLGSWWLYLVFKFSAQLQLLNHPLLRGDLIKMIKWEGVTFFILLFSLTLTLVYIYIQDLRKTKSMQAFFASLTHELKTPLASMNLQTQVLQDQILDLDISENELTQIQKYMNRLITDASKLEDQLDNHLQLSRVERKAPLNTRPLSFCSFIKQEQKRYQDQIQISCDTPEDFFVLADDFAAKTILRNIIENSIRHSKVEHPQLTLNRVGSNIIEIRDNGGDFKGDLNKLGHLFYKFDSPKGSGIGLYLISKLMKQMKGEASFLIEEKKLVIHLRFNLPLEDQEC